MDDMPGDRELLALAVVVCLTLAAILGVALRFVLRHPPGVLWKAGPARRRRAAPALSAPTRSRLS